MIASTVITASYAPYARVLGHSFLEHHPGARFAVLVVDDSSGDVVVDERFIRLRPADLGIDDRELHRRAVMFDSQGLTCSMKPALLRQLLIQEGADATALLLDADSCVYGDLRHATELAGRHDIVLTPHSTVAREDFDVEPMIIRTGAFNAGFVAVGAGALPFLDWWDQRTARRCVADPGSGVFNEQAWLDLVPGLFEHHVLTDPGVNVSGFGMHYRDVVWDGDRGAGVPALEDGPLRHFHFLCRFDPEFPEQLTGDPAVAQHWPAPSTRPGFVRLAREYAQRLMAVGYREARAAPAPFDALPDGTPLTPLIRRLYRDGVIEADRTGGSEPPNPWDAGISAFLSWLNEPAGGAPGTPEATRYLMALHAERADLILAFPDVPGADMPAFLAWAASKTDAEQDGIPAALAPPAQPAKAPRPWRPERTLTPAADHEHLARAYDTVLHSRSWRFTAPARRLAARARGARRNGR